MNCPHCGKPITPALIRKVLDDEFLTMVSAAASIMGKVSSPAKTLAARENAKKPRKKKLVAK